MHYYPSHVIDKTQRNSSENTHPIRLRPGPARTDNGKGDKIFDLMGCRRDTRRRIAQSVEDNVIKKL